MGECSDALEAALQWYSGSGASRAGSARTCQRWKGTVRCVLSSDSQSKRCKSQRPNERMRLINPRGYHRLRMVGVVGATPLHPKTPPPPIKVIFHNKRTTLLLTAFLKASALISPLQSAEQPSPENKP